MARNGQWPVLKRYDQDHLSRIALPLGGIGTGTVSLGGRGDLRDWEIANRPAKGFVPRQPLGAAPFFALRTKVAGAAPVTRILEGPLELSEYEGQSGSPAPNHGLPRFERCSFAAAYPLGQVMLSDRRVPVRVRLEAFNPLIPGDPDRSGIPVAVLRFALTNRTSASVNASLCGSLLNFIGQDGAGGASRDNRNSFRDGSGYRGIFMQTRGLADDAAGWGTMALATTAGRGVTHRTAWKKVGWGSALLDFWDDFEDDGCLQERQREGEDAPMGSLAVALRLPPRTTREVTFVIAWHFPNRYTWTPAEGDKPCPEDRIGNYYTTRYRDAWDVLRKTVPQLRSLESETVNFVRAFCDSDLPEVVKEAALFNLSTLRTQTCFRTPDGKFFGWEGYSDNEGCCFGSCTHVWNYEQALAFLFGDLARQMREVEFGEATDADGMMSFRVSLPIERATSFGKAAADGQMGCIMKVYRDWQLCGDDDWLRSLFPRVKKALEFCWIDGGWDGDCDGVMEGCQHNTMDVEYYGPNPQMGAWYLGALRAAEEMARHLGDGEFADHCRGLFDRGSGWMDEHLFNGEYYEHEIRPPQRSTDVADSLRVGMGAATGLKELDYQLGAGCLVDQLIGQLMAHVCGLGYLLKRANVRKTLRSIMRYNLRNGLSDHRNVMRSYALGEESALLMASYPRERPENPFPYFTEVMTGFEYTAAIGMLYEGQEKNGLQCMQNTRDRYDGRKRSPFDEAECGHHYARAMITWAAGLALSGFRFSGVERMMRFSRRPGTWFWSNGYAWGTCTLKPRRSGMGVTLSVLHGSLVLSRFEIADVGEHQFARTARIGRGRSRRFVVK
jgi:uncharacterized protein (DUF608 family)